MNKMLSNSGENKGNSKKNMDQISDTNSSLFWGQAIQWRKSNSYKMNYYPVLPWVHFSSSFSPLTKSILSSGFLLHHEDDARLISFLEFNHYNPLPDNHLHLELSSTAATGQQVEIGICCRYKTCTRFQRAWKYISIFGIFILTKCRHNNILALSKIYYQNQFHLFLFTFFKCDC